MTFEQFQETRQHTNNLGITLHDEMLRNCAGYLYCGGSLWIEDTTQWTEDAPGYGKGQFYTLIGRAEYQSDDLETIERHLYDFAVREGYEAD